MAEIPGREDEEQEPLLPPQPQLETGLPPETLLQPEEQPQPEEEAQPEEQPQPEELQESQKEEISKDDVLSGRTGTEVISKPAGTAKRFGRLTPKEKAGLRLAHWTGIIGCIIIVLLLGQFFWSIYRLPPPPLLDQTKLTAPTNLPDAEAIFAYYKSISDLQEDRTTKIFDIVITKTLLPIFTLVLGFVFGSRVEREGEEEEEDSNSTDAK